MVAAAAQAYATVAPMMSLAALELVSRPAPPGRSVGRVVCAVVVPHVVDVVCVSLQAVVVDGTRVVVGRVVWFA
jgi:hypothetical protein